MRIKLLVSVIFVNPTSIYAVLFSSLHLLRNKDSFITPLQLLFLQYSFHHSVFYIIKIISSLQLLFMQYCFHHSSFCLYSILFITPASICTVFFSSIQRLFQLRVIFNKSHFCWHKQLFSSFQLLFTQRISVINRNSI